MRRGMAVVAVTIGVGLCGLADASAQGKTRVSIEGDRWLIDGRPTHPGSQAEGLLMNVRMVNSVFEDVGTAGREKLGRFDPQENTRRFIARIDEYAKSGVAAFTISLQGGMAGYEGAINSAFHSDGSLDETYLRRVASVIEACDRQGLVVILSCFYQRQHSHERALADRQAIITGTENVARWIRRSGFTNVLLEVSNEYAHGGFHRWTDGGWIMSEDGQVELVRRARAAAPGLLVSTSGMGGGRMPEAIARECDFLLIHFNNTPLEQYGARIAEARRHGKPVVCNEDHKIGEQGAAAARASVEHGAGWGFMHVDKNQLVPFEFDGVQDDPIVYAALAALTRPGGRVVQAAPAGPTVLISRPGDGAVFAAGADIRIEANIDAGGKSVGELRFFADDRQIGQCKTAPWSMVWRHAPAGAHNLSAVLYDADGNRLAAAPPVDIQVTAASP